MGEFRKEVRSWGLCGTNSKMVNMPATHEKACSKFINMTSIIAALSVILTLSIVVSFRMMINYSAEVGSDIEEYMLENEIIDIFKTQDYVEASSTMELKDIAANMREEIISTMDMEELERSLERGVIPDQLSEIFKKYLNDVCTVPGLDPEPNNIMIFMEQGVIADFSHVFAYDSDESRTWEVEKRYEQNKKLYDNTIQAILTQDSRNLYAEQLVRVDSSDDVYMPEYVDKTIIAKIYREEGLEGLKYYTFLVPVYIDEDGDIFGNADIVNGKRIHNKKFILVQRYSLYDYISGSSEPTTLYRIITSKDGQRLEGFMVVSGLLLSILSIVILGGLSVIINGMIIRSKAMEITDNDFEVENAEEDIEKEN